MADKRIETSRHWPGGTRVLGISLGRYSRAASIAVLFLALSGLSVSWGQEISGKVEIHFIDVGQADAILVMSPKRDCVMLIDSGDTRYPDSAKNFKQYVSERIPKGHRINLVVSSHPHSDHIGSMRWVLLNYRVQTFIDNGQDYPRSTAKGNPTIFGRLMNELQRQVKENGLKHLAQNKVSTPDQDFCPAKNLDTMIVYPKAGYEAALCRNNQNNCSVVVKMTYNKTSFLFPGDAEREQEEILLKDQAVREKLPSQVLKAAHHGSDTSSSREFVKTVSPKWIVVSSGKRGIGTNTTYKHPRLSTIETLSDFVAAKGVNQRIIDVFDKAKAKWRKKSISGNLYVTAKGGSIVLSSDGKEIRRE